MVAPTESHPASPTACEPSRLTLIRTTRWRPPRSDPFPKPEGGAAAVKQRPFPDIQLSQTGEWLWRGAGGGVGDAGPRCWHGGAAALAAAAPRPAVPRKRCLPAGEGQDGSQQDHPGAEGHYRPQTARRRGERAQPGKGAPAGGPPHARHGGVWSRRQGRGATPALRRDRPPAGGAEAEAGAGRVAALARR